MEIVNENELWTEYFKKRDIKIRNKLVSYYFKLVEYLSFKVSKNKDIKEDLINIGIISLIEAIEKFNPEYNVKFITYAYYKIYGSMVDYLRNLDFLNNKIINDNNKKLKIALINLKEKGINFPTDEEIANELNLNIQEFYNFLNNTFQSKISSLEELVEKELNANEKLLYKSIIIDIINKKLTDVEKLIITLYYYEDLTFKEIGEILNLTEARISQLHLIAISKIKANIIYDKVINKL